MSSESEPNFNSNNTTSTTLFHSLSPTEYQPLLSADRHAWNIAPTDFIGRHIVSVHGEDSLLYRSRRGAQKFLSSKWGHYSVLALVIFDVGCIFADFLVTLHTCGRGEEMGKGWDVAKEALGVASLVFSCLFLAELVMSIWAFGFAYVKFLFFFKPWSEDMIMCRVTELNCVMRRYFHSKFHCFDALVIITSFVIDVTLHGVEEEVGSLVIILRLWRVFKIIEEFSAAGEEQLDQLMERIEVLENENRELRSRLAKQSPEEIADQEE